VSQFYDQFLVPVGLRATQFPILATLKQLGPLSINALAEELVMDRTTLTRNIQPLERDGWIRIRAIPSDRRAKELHLTAAGENRLRAAVKAWMQAQAQFERSFGAEHAVELRTLLLSVVSNDFTLTRQSADR